MRAGSSRTTTALVEGVNILAASAKRDGTSRFARYLVTGQRQGTDTDFGEDAALVQGSARDAGVRRTDRVLLVRAESGVTPQLAAQRAAWEASVRAGRAESASVMVQGWTQGDGTLWPVNARVPIRSPSLEFDGEMLITETTFRIDSGGTTTELRLRPPGAFLPEPVVTESAGGVWKELRP
jgi:prophage tail gpP-like protein